MSFINITMDGFLYKIGFFENLIYFTAHKLILGLFVFFILILMRTPLSHIENSPAHLNANIVRVDFSDFSPAFAALEDEFLFTDTKPELMSSGRDELNSDKIINSTTHEKLRVVTANPQKTNLFDSLSFDGSQALLKEQIKKPLSAKTRSITVDSKSVDGELGVGALASLVAPRFPQENTIVKPNATPLPTTTPLADQAKKEPLPDVTTQSDSESTTLSVPETIRVSGNVSLKEGLAYFGDMDVSWIIGDQEYARGSINTSDATFTIDVKDNIGDVVISLYDNKSELIGEGFVDLTQVKIIDGKVRANIDIYPINWDTAGRVIDASSLGLQEYGVYKQRNLKNVLVELYAFSEATETDASGEFSFYNWKKSNSRSLAIASKKGFKDSLFLLDSKKELSVLLFSNEYMNSFFSYLKDLGLPDIANKGTIYGSVLGKDVQGYVMSLEKQKPIYFLTSGFANIYQKATSSNGQFAFVGLDDGEYEVVTEKDGQIVDRKIVLVEQNKISPVLVDLKSVSKHLEFFNPLNPEEEISSVKAFFFDGETEVKLNHNNSTFMSVNNSSQPSLFDFEGRGLKETSRTFISHNKGLQRIPLLQDEALLNLAETNNMSLKKGLIIGFIHSSHAYHVSMKEALPEKIIYFDEFGKELSDPSKVPSGFIMGGFSKGLSSVIVLRNADNMILMTDLVFSDHDSISIINSSISAVDN